MCCFTMVNLWIDYGAVKNDRYEGLQQRILTTNKKIKIRYNM